MSKKTSKKTSKKAMKPQNEPEIEPEIKITPQSRKINPIKKFIIILAISYLFLVVLLNGQAKISRNNE